MQRLILKLSDEFILVQTEWIELSEILRKDFWSFLVDNQKIEELRAPIEIHIFLSADRPSMPEEVASMQTQNAITYDQGNMRFCDYYGQAYTDIDFKTNKANIYGTDFERIHEIAYLLILSRAGKNLDLKGLHKLHAFAISYKGIAFVCMMPSKGGKSTMLVELLKNLEVKMISDDIPLIDSWGRVHPFPLKLGLNEIPEELEIKDIVENIYFMKREHYGEKKLICTRGIKDRVENIDAKFTKIVLAEAFRYNSPHSIILSSSWLKTFGGLFKHGVLGLGSPIIIEYFWQSGWRDFIIKTRIFLLRCLAFFSLSIRARKIKIYSGHSPKETAGQIINFLEKIK